MTSLENTAENWYYNNTDDFINGLMSDGIVLDVEYESDCVNNNVEFIIKFNNNEVISFKLKKERKIIRLELNPTHRTQTLEMSMTGKCLMDTIVHNDQIVKDTFLKLIDIRINHYKILDDLDFFNNKFHYEIHQDQKSVIPMAGFWTNATLKILFDIPFDLWYNANSNKNDTIADSLKYRSDNTNLLIKDLEQSLQKLD